LIAKEGPMTIPAEMIETNVVEALPIKTVRRLLGLAAV